MVINMGLEDLDQKVFDEFMKLDLEFDLQCDGTTIAERYIDIDVADNDSGKRVIYQTNTWYNKRVLDEKGIKYGRK